MAAELDTFRTGEHAGTGRVVFGGELPWHKDGVKLTEDEQRQFDRVAICQDDARVSQFLPSSRRVAGRER